MGTHSLPTFRLFCSVLCYCVFVGARHPSMESGHSAGGWRWFLGDWRKHKLHAGSCCNSGTNLRGVANPRRNPRQFLLKNFFGSYCMSTRCFFFTTFCGVFQQKFVATNNRTKTTRKPNQTITRGGDSPPSEMQCSGRVSERS